MSKTYQTVARVRGTEEWKAVTYSGDMFYSDENGLPQMKQMVEIMKQAYRNIEYKIVEAAE